MTFIEPKSLSEGFTDFRALPTVSRIGTETKEHIVERLSRVRDMSNRGNK